MLSAGACSTRKQDSGETVTGAPTDPHQQQVRSSACTVRKSESIPGLGVTKVPATKFDERYGGFSVAQSAGFIEEKLCPTNVIGWH